MNYCVNILAHNEEKTISECISSILNQSLDDEDHLEIIVVSNGCSDGTDDAVLSIANNDKRVSLFSIKEGGKVNALRTYLKSDYYADTNNNNKIVFFMDADVQLRESFILRQLAENILSDDALYAVSASCIPESVYNNNMDFVSCLFRVQAKLNAHFRPNILRGMLYCIRTDILQSISFPQNLLSDDVYLEISLDGHFKTDYDSPIVYSLHRGIQREIRRNFMHCLGVLQAYLYLKEKKVTKFDTASSKASYKAKYFSKHDIVKYIVKNMDIQSLIYLMIYNIYYKYNGAKARRLLNKYGADGMDYRSYWKTRQ